eukprot:TRINITY_DN2250_c0_g1_i2.p1 TRINITY_DN2250_c0_g1~~TRINITY_DN2250_c0_g1_i2.p1  ORF type:complete len:265 (-),score=28.90 TRINITY_DN2250_c0_g1_i2:111-905(-)
MDFRHTTNFKRIGNYRLGEIIGGMCDTYNEVRLGVHIPTSARVAVKIIDIRTERVRVRAHHELQVLRSVGAHKNVVNLHAAEEESDCLYMFLEYAPGGDLWSYIEKNGPVSEYFARSMIQQLVSALEFCHSKGIVHHDVKLENILLVRENEVLLSDFGFSQCFVEGESRKMVTTYSGSPLYMAPEVFSLQPHDELVDMWSLGICLYYIGLEEAVTFQELRFTPSMNISPSLQDFISQMLTKDPASRVCFSQLKRHKWLQEDTRP